MDGLPRSKSVVSKTAISSAPLRTDTQFTITLVFMDTTLYYVVLTGREGCHMLVRTLGRDTGADGAWKRVGGNCRRTMTTTTTTTLRPFVTRRCFVSISARGGKFHGELSVPTSCVKWTSSPRCLHPRENNRGKGIDWYGWWWFDVTVTLRCVLEGGNWWFKVTVTWDAFHAPVID